ncbi:low affinity immunoglobulin gamma Fc region receptor III-A-like [Menidia menidia]
MVVLDSDEATVSVSVTPPRSQFFKYESFSVGCEGEPVGWTVMKRTVDGEVHPCLPPCSVQAAFPSTDSGEHWCESGLGEKSNRVNITVTGGRVILESPVLPLTEGGNVGLKCRCQPPDACQHGVFFHKDGILLRNSSTGTITIQNVSRSDQGLYSCRISRLEESPQSWVAVRAPPAGQDPPAAVSMLHRHLIVGAPYCLSTILLLLIYKDMRRQRGEGNRRQPAPH